MATIVKPLLGSSGVIFPSQMLPAGPGKGVSASIPVDNYEDIIFFVTYTRSGVGGGFLLKIEYSLDNINWYGAAEYQSAVIVPGTDVVVATQNKTYSYIATGVSAERWASPTISVGGHWMRATIGEASAFPGTAEIQFYMKGDN